MKENVLKATLATVTGYFLALLGGWDKVLEILVILIVLDYLTGLCVAFKEHSVSSEIGHKGLLKKAMIFIVIILAAQLDRVVENPANLFRTAAGLFYIANEGISITENVGFIGLPLPKFVVKVLQQLRDKNNVIDNNEEENQDG